MMPDYQSELKSIVEAIVNTGLAQKIILFGSCARGEQTEESDIDIAVLSDRTDMKRMDIMFHLQMARPEPIHVPMDIIAFYSDSFSENSRQKFTIESTISEEGVTLYERAAGTAEYVHASVS